MYISRQSRDSASIVGRLLTLSSRQKPFTSFCIFYKRGSSWLKIQSVGPYRQQRSLATESLQGAIQPLKLVTLHPQTLQMQRTVPELRRRWTGVPNSLRGRVRKRLRLKLMRRQVCSKYIRKAEVIWQCMADEQISSSPKLTGSVSLSSQSSQKSRAAVPMTSRRE